MSIQEIALNALLHFLIAVIAYVFGYMNATEFRSERKYYPGDILKESNRRYTWNSIMYDLRETLRLLRIDFFGVHCLWSKATSIRYRVQMAHDMLQYETHEKGWRVEDCHDPVNHARIANDCFCSRTRFWLTEIVRCVLFPFGLFLIFVACILWIIVNAAIELKRWVVA